MDDKKESEDQPLSQEDLEKTVGGGMERPRVDERTFPQRLGSSQKEWWE